VRFRSALALVCSVAMSLLGSEMYLKVAACQGALKAVSEHLELLCCKNPADVRRKLAPMEDAELQVAMAYGVASLYFSHLLTQGIDPSDHPIKQELDRIQKYFKKLRDAKETLAFREGVRKRARVDTEAASRIVQHYASAAEARAQRGATSSSVGLLAPRQQAQATEPDAAEDSEDVDQSAAGDAADVEAAAEEDAVPVDDVMEPHEIADAVEDAASEAAAAVAADTGEAVEDKEPPAKRRKRRVEARASVHDLPKIRLDGEPRLSLVPMGVAGAEEHATAAALVAKGKAEVMARRQRRKELARAKAAAVAGGT